MLHIISLQYPVTDIIMQNLMVLVYPDNEDVESVMTSKFVEGISPAKVQFGSLVI